MFIKDLRSKFVIDNLVIDNHCLSNTYWPPQLHKTPIKAKFTVISPQSSIKILAKTITSAFQLFIKRSKILMINIDFLQEPIPFGSYKITDLQ